MPRLGYALSLIGAALAASAAQAQTVAPPPTPPAAEPAAIAAPAAPASPVPACELHVWPAARVVAMTQGVGAGFGLVGALVDAAAHADQNKRDTAFITGTLDAQAQAQVLFHDQGIDIARDDPKRLSDSTAPCYTEFVVRGLSYFQGVLYSGQMRTFLEVRRYDGATVKVDFRDSKHEDLNVKLPKDGEDTGPATDALLAAFRGDVAFFSDKFARKYP